MFSTDKRQAADMGGGVYSRRVPYDPAGLQPYTVC